MDCIFCKIVGGEIPAEKVGENEHAIAIPDIHPVSKGHAMVLPKEHAETLLELQDESIGPVFKLVKEVTEQLKKELFDSGDDGPVPHSSAEQSSAGFTIGMNHGKVAGQAVPHLHIHIIPRYKGDGGKSIHGIVDTRP